MKQYIPKRGDFISLSFDPQSGHEQKGRRPALVISHTLFNEKTGMAIVCPVTNTDRKNPLHVKLGDSCVLTGVVMVDQIKSVDYVSRQAKHIDKATQAVLNDVLSIVDACIFEEE
jgi:mRNA interferase MazF